MNSSEKIKWKLIGVLIYSVLLGLLALFSLFVANSSEILPQEDPTEIKCDDVVRNQFEINIA